MRLSGLARQGRMVLVFLLGVLVASALWLASGWLGRPAAPKEPAPEVTPAETTESRTKAPGFEFDRTSMRVLDPANGGVRWDIRAESVDADSRQNQAVLGNISADYFEDGAAAYRIAARSATFDWADGSVEFEGGVMLQGKDGTLLSCDRLTWSTKRNLAVAAGHVSYEAGGTMVRGDRLEADLSLRRVRVSGGVRMQSLETGGNGAGR